MRTAFWVSQGDKMKNRATIWLLASIPLTAITFAAPVSAGDSTRFQSKDVFDLEVASDPRPSPDGETIIYVRRSGDINVDRFRPGIWTVNVDGNNHRPLLTGEHNYSSPRWSPSGDRIAYISNQSGKSQIHIRWMDTGQTSKITNLTVSPGNVAWSPDGKSLAFTSFVSARGPSLATPPAKPEGAKWAPPVKVTDKVVYRRDGRGDVRYGFNHVFVIPADGGTPRQITSGDFHHNSFSWDSNSENLLVVANRIEDWEYDVRESEIYRVSLTGEYTALTNRDGPDNSPRASPDGSRIAYLGNDEIRTGSATTSLYVMNADGSGARSVTGDLDRSVNSPVWKSDGSGLYVQSTHEGVTNLYSLSLEGDMEVVVANIGGASLGRPYASGGFGVGSNGTIAVLQGTPLSPADLGVLTSTGVRKLTALNDDLFAGKDLGEVEEIWYKSSHDGQDIQGWILKPPGFDASKKYPLILEIHGGPHAAYGPHFSAEVQLYAAAGNVVLWTNPRGSTSYGFEFANAIQLAYPGYDYDDLMSGVDTLIAKGYVDEDQLFVTGGSGGGVLSAWIVGKTDRFAAAAVQKPVINWLSFNLYADLAVNFGYYWFSDTVWDDPMQHWNRSPLSLVGNVTTPTLLITGESDHRTPSPEAEQFYMALKLQKVDTILVRVPGASHGIASRPSNLIAKVDNILGWFARYRNDEEAVESISAAD